MTEDQQTKDTNQIKVVKGYCPSFVKRNRDAIIIGAIFAVIAIGISFFIYFVSDHGNKGVIAKQTEETKGIIDKALADQTKVLVSQLNARDTKKDPEGTERTIDNLKGQNISQLDSEIIEATKLQIQEQYDKSIDTWLAIATATEKNDKKAANAYFSAAYLIQEYKGKDQATVNRVIALYNKSIELYPIVSAYNNRGLAKSKMGEHKKAIADINEAIRLKPDLVEAYNNRGAVKIKMDRFEEAIEDFNEAIKLKPDLAEAYNNRGAVKSRMGKHEEAIADYSEAIKLNPRFPEAYYNQGNTKNITGRFEEAIADLNKAIKLKPDYPDAYYIRGLAKSNLGRFEEAIADFNEIIKLDPDLVSAYIGLGIANTSLGKYDEARADIRKALELEPGNELAKLAIAEIEAKDKN